MDPLRIVDEIRLLRVEPFEEAHREHLARQVEKLIASDPAAVRAALADTLTLLEEHAAGPGAAAVITRGRDALAGTQPAFAALPRDERADRITAAIANTAECAAITVTVHEDDGPPAPLRRLARCLDAAGLIDYQGI